jgi:hypothetical protein
MLQIMGWKQKKYHISDLAPLVVLGMPFFKYVQGTPFLGMTEAFTSGSLMN